MKKRTQLDKYRKFFIRYRAYTGLNKINLLLYKYRKDTGMDIKAIQEKLSRFSEERDWDQFQSPKNLSMALVGEAAELLEIFQWLTDQQSREIINSEKQMALVREEIADVFLFLVRIADKLDVDIEEAALEKLEINAIKYPVKFSKGNAEKYNRRRK